jgi:hypothetical protein
MSRSSALVADGSSLNSMYAKPREVPFASQTNRTCASNASQLPLCEADAPWPKTVVDAKCPVTRLFHAPARSKEFGELCLGDVRRKIGHVQRLQ